ncbi:Ubiquitin-like protein 3 [Harpegnathos saltator]|uniref:Ubiquitin-like protein 3 n=1 Tax=Harpegnathos saltator TaxID=610380 RepID=E2BXA0_HARSA|nr:Ubiquitin-like protein 3 [Harpegnathos saltator]
MLPWNKASQRLRARVIDSHASLEQGNRKGINLRLILVSGKTKEFLFSPSDSAGDIAHHVFENWPEDWAEEAVAKAEILRLIYQGRFLHSNVTLGALGLPFGKTTVMHLVPRENLPEPNSQVRGEAKSNRPGLTLIEQSSQSSLNIGVTRHH